MSGYEPTTYWSERLSANFNLTGVGHAGFSPEYNRHLYRRKASVLSQLLEPVPPGAYALDIGSGVGWVVAQLLDQGLSVDGCDLVPVALERLPASFPSATFFPLSLGAGPIPRVAESYDVVTMLDVAYHITDPALWERGLAEISRVLKPGGRLIVTDRLGDTTVRFRPHVLFRSEHAWREHGEAVGMSFTEVGPLYAWLSRSKHIRGWRHVPDGVRGRLEYGLERLLPLRPHLRWAVLTKRG